MTERSSRFHSCVGLGWFSFKDSSKPYARCYCLSRSILKADPTEPVSLNSPKWVHRLVAKSQGDTNDSKEASQPTVVTLLPFDKAIKRYGCIGCMVYSSDLTLFRCLGYGMKISAVYHEKPNRVRKEAFPQQEIASPGLDVESIPHGGDFSDSRDYIRVELGIAGTDLDYETQSAQEQFPAPNAMGDERRTNDVPPPAPDWHERAQLYSALAKQVGNRSVDILWINFTTLSSFVSSPITSASQIYERSCELGSRIVQVVERCNRLVGAVSPFIKSPPELPPT